MDTQIIVLGAGVIGLTTALVLKQRGYKRVTIVAKYVPGDMCIEYTSPFAGAHWRTMAMNDNPLFQKFDAVSYKKFMGFAGNKQGNINEQVGIMTVPSYDYYDDNSTPEVTDPWFQNIVQDFKFLTEGLPQGVKTGFTYTTALINSPVYLKWLQSQFEKLGGTIIKKSITHIDEVFRFIGNKEPYAALINCTGLGARFLGGVQDDKVFPTRGQTVVVYAPHIKKTITHVSTQGMTYIIPRSDGTVILGGTANKHDFNPYIDEATVQSILTRTAALCPEIDSSLKIVRHAVGLRPSREGGARFENEIRRSKHHDFALYVTHAYGHGGFGIQSSWGSAEYIVELMEKGLSLTKSRL
ncbi:hypothetical protein HPULCUR_007211 [Helicostylum pulchrum]|uniref:FAD dependent oxidoreductase domain-containing protein n=1 Tax=Helicostylum pulchrum TaxID=562976 RepID=A0ABP9Y436_9FUNG